MKSKDHRVLRRFRIVSLKRCSKQHDDGYQAIDGEQDIRRVGVATSVEVLSIKGVDDIRCIVVASLVYMLAIPSVKDVRCISIATSVDVLAVIGKQYI